MARLKALGLSSSSSSAPQGEPRVAIEKSTVTHSGEPSSASEAMKKGWRARLEYAYEYEYKKLAYFTIIILLLAFVQIGYQIATTGDFISKGVSLKGGITVTIVETPLSPADIEDFLHEKFPGYDVAARSIANAGGAHGLIIEADITDPTAINSFQELVTEKLDLKKGEYTLEQIGSSLGESFFLQVILSLVVAFALMAIMVIAWFRNLGPSMMVILAGFCDLVETIAIINILGIKVSTAGIAALLMLIGYSVDTDILLSSRVLKRKEGTVYDATVDAFKTGIVMTITAMAAVTVGYFASQSVVLKQIMLILFIGLIFDIFNTWIQNAALLRWYVNYQEKKKARGGQL